MARYYGHTRIKVLDGGWDAWCLEGRETTSARTTPPAGAFVARPQPTLIATTDYVNAALRKRDVQLLDVRGDDEWTRAVSNESAIAGHIPGALHLLWTAVIDASTRRFLPGESLRAAFLAAGIVPGREVVSYCQGGIRAAHTMLALHLAGIAPARNYEGSWAAWSKAGTPIELPVAQSVGDGQ
ncbi:MAG: sulfurtransferase [Gammaproteobacteria bacterium]